MGVEVFRLFGGAVEVGVDVGELIVPAETAPQHQVQGRAAQVLGEGGRPDAEAPAADGAFVGAVVVSQEHHDVIEAVLKRGVREQEQHTRAQGPQEQVVAPLHEQVDHHKDREARERRAHEGEVQAQEPGGLNRQQGEAPGPGVYVHHPEEDERVEKQQEQRVVVQVVVAAVQPVVALQVELKALARGEVVD